MSLVDELRPAPAKAAETALVEVRNLKKYFPITKGFFVEKEVGAVKAVDGVSFTIGRGETLGLVGESGCGKSTLAKCMLLLEEPTDGEILFDGENVAGVKGKRVAPFRRRVQAVFQDPFSSLNPRMRVEEIVGEPLYVHNVERDAAARSERVRRLLNICGLPSRLVDRYPHEMSGGQRQRVGIARALALNPDFIVCDEAVSALDVSIQAQIIRLLEDLRGEFGLTYLFIGHDLSVVRHISHRVAVMYLGKIVEIGGSDELFARPRHPYTQALLSAVPVPDPAIEHGREHKVVTGELPSPIDPPPGCVFHPRCPLAVEECRQAAPQPRDLGNGHLAACIRTDEAQRAFT